jgi:hypothetical protein
MKGINNFIVQSWQNNLLLISFEIRPDKIWNFHTLNTERNFERLNFYETAKHLLNKHGICIMKSVGFNLPM